MANEFTKRDGTVIEVEDYTFTIPASDMTSILRLKEDWEARDEYPPIRTVILKALAQGIKSTRHYWDAADKSKLARDFAKHAAGCFNPDGTVKDAEGLAKLAIAKGLVKGSAQEV